MQLEGLFDRETTRRKLQLTLVQQLLAYFDSTYRALYYQNPACQTPVIILMTQDLVRATNLFQGPIPLLFTPPQDEVEYDYREMNDERAGVYARATGELNPKMTDVLRLSTPILTLTVDRIDKRMSGIADGRSRRVFTAMLKGGERKTGYGESAIVKASETHDYNKALRQLQENYQSVLAGLRK